MRRSASLMIPLTIIVIYYAFWVGAVVFMLRRFPALGEYLPLGGISELAASDAESFEPVTRGSSVPCCPQRDPCACCLQRSGPAS